MIEGAVRPGDTVVVTGMKRCKTTPSSRLNHPSGTEEVPMHKAIDAVNARVLR